MAKNKEFPTKKDITKGAILDIYNREAKKLGVGKLIKRRPSRYISEGLPFTVSEKTNPVQDSTIVVWKSERWEVEWLEHSYYRKGDRTCTEVCWFVKTCRNFDSYSEPSYSEKGVKGRYILVEESGVLEVSGEYQNSAVRALKQAIKTFRGEVVLYAHSKWKARERFEINKLGRILDFIDSTEPYEASVINYLYENKPDDFLILAGNSVCTLPNTIICDPNTGLKLKPKQTK